MTTTYAEGLALLALGHTVGAHALGIVPAQRLVAATLAVAVSHLLCLLPVIDETALLWVAALTVAYPLIEKAVGALERRFAGGLRWLLVRHAGHAAVLVALASTSRTNPLTWHLAQDHRALAFRLAVMTSAFILVAVAGSAIVRQVLGDQHAQASQPSGMGQRIGILERCLALILGVMDAWAGLGLIVAVEIDRAVQRPRRSRVRGVLPGRHAVQRAGRHPGRAGGEVGAGVHTSSGMSHLPAGRPDR